MADVRRNPVGSSRFSVAMATYNGSQYLAEQLDSLARQTQLPHELVVCDDASTADASTEDRVPVGVVVQGVPCPDNANVHVILIEITSLGESFGGHCSLKRRRNRHMLHR